MNLERFTMQCFLSLIHPEDVERAAELKGSENYFLFKAKPSLKEIQIRRAFDVEHLSFYNSEYRPRPRQRATISKATLLIGDAFKKRVQNCVDKILL